MKTRISIHIVVLLTCLGLTIVTSAQRPAPQEPQRPPEPPTGLQPPHQQPQQKPPQETPPLPTKPPEQRGLPQPGATEKGPQTDPDLTLPVPIDSFFDVFVPIVGEPSERRGPPAPPAEPKKEACGFTSKKLLRTIESGWKPKKADAVALPGRDAVVIVTWENDIENEFEVVGPCPLEKGHGGDHKPKNIIYEKLGTLTQTESYPPGTRRPKPPQGTGLPQVSR